MQTKSGALKARDSNLARNPNHYSEIGKIGGSRKVKKGFAVTGKAREAGSIGGRRSKRKWTLEERLNHGKAMRKAWMS